MSLTLKIATATTIVLTKARSLMNGTVMQKVGTSFTDVTSVTATQNVGKTGTAKTRVVIRRPFSTVIDGVTVTDYCYYELSSTVPAICPLANAAEGPWLMQSMAADPAFADLVVNRVNSLA